MHEYEGIFIVNPEKEASLDEVISSITTNITRNKGGIIKEERWGKRPLAYPVKKKREGIYYKLNFSIDPSHITGLNSAYKLNQSILRVMIVKR